MFDQGFLTKDEICDLYCKNVPIDYIANMVYDRYGCFNKGGAKRYVEKVIYEKNKDCLL